MVLNYLNNNLFKLLNDLQGVPKEVSQRKILFKYKVQKCTL